MLLSDICLTSDVCLSVAYGPNLKTDKPRKTKIGTEVDSDTTFKVKRSKINLLLMS